MQALRVHGGRIDLAAIHYPNAPRPWLDLSTGINPCAWTADPMPEVDVHSLPSPDALSTLEAAAAKVFGTTPDRVVALPGSELGLRMLRGLHLPAPIRYVAPSYATHASVRENALPVVRASIDAIDGGTLILANPNNPDGCLDAPERLLTIARGGTWLVVDEAFADVAPASSVIPLVGPDDPVIAFRSFGKFFGLPGIRLGFMIAPSSQAAAMRDRLGSWPISAHAVAYGIAAYRDTGWIGTARKSIIDRAARLDAMLSRHGLQVRGDCALFRLVETGDAYGLFDRLARTGILTRTFDYASRWLRMGVPGSDAAFERLDQALGHG
ncbi:threonine-phosphate decarboxylase [Sphingomonas sp. R86520]|uniref:threonine-phosphate decarboxylase n=1 Tax=Sphingomonas sp. R86520 TaxID=3093859 RepID=UPI0036D3DAF7